MDIYSRKSRWKILLSVAGVIIVLITMVYSNYLANRLAENENKNVRLFAQALENILNNPDLNAEFSLQDTIISTNTVPVILEDESGNLTGSNFGPKKDNDSIFLQLQKEKILKSGYPPISGTGYANRIYYQNTRLYRLIRYYPFVQVLLVASFILFGYLAFSSSRRAEQNRVWAGMAKETAHQLGTPISAIIAWIEHLKVTTSDSEQLEIIQELSKDVERLELIADRFSKIGSAPKLDQVNVVDEMNEMLKYMKRRAAKKVVFHFPENEPSEPIFVSINKHLFDWVIENILRNSLDAMDGEGSITVQINEDTEGVHIDIKDSGKGIQASKFKTVFEPGFSTKKRGWGLGLSLAKRIIENYHKGKIFVKNSKINEGTTFSIILPSVD
jgi:signal transduction histidine kinase